MLISVVVATYNRRALLPKTLGSVLEQTHPSADYEVVLVIDGSTDGTAEYARSLSPDCHLEVIEQPNSGPAAARNAGIAAASGELILFLDDDIRCASDLIEQHAAGHGASYEEALVHGAIYLAPESPPTLAAAITGAWYLEHNREVAAHGLRPDRNVYLNANTSIAKHALTDLGGFDLEIPFPREDFELGLRIWKAGVPLRYRPEAVAYEVFEKPTASFAGSDAAGNARADVAICRKHPDYRPHSVLAPADPPTRLDNSLRRGFRRLPSGSERLLSPSVAVTERLAAHPGARWLGTRLVAVQRRMVFERTASEAAGSPAEFEAQFDRRLSVLLYHRVGPPVAGVPEELTVSPRRFERQVDWLARRGYRGVSPAEWKAWRDGQSGLPPKAVLFTFDDGYADIAEHALPVLRSHGFSALVFVVTSMLGRAVTWSGEGVELPGPPLLAAGDIRGLAEQGFAFGAHGRTHRALTELSDDELEDELAGSRSDLEQLVGPAAASAFAYPFGAWDQRVSERASSIFDLAFTTEPGTNGLATEPALLRRCGVGPTDSVIDVEWRARVGHVPLRGARDATRLRIRARALRGDRAR